MSTWPADRRLPNPCEQSRSYLFVEMRQDPACEGWLVCTELDARVLRLRLQESRTASSRSLFPDVVPRRTDAFSATAGVDPVAALGAVVAFMMEATFARRFALLLIGTGESGL